MVGCLLMVLALGRVLLRWRLCLLRRRRLRCLLIRRVGTGRVGRCLYCGGIRRFCGIRRDRSRLRMGLRRPYRLTGRSCPLVATGYLWVTRGRLVRVARLLRRPPWRLRLPFARGIRLLDRRLWRGRLTLLCRLGCLLC